MYFSLSAIALCSTLISQTAIVSSAPVFSNRVVPRNGGAAPELDLRELALQHGYARRQDDLPSDAAPTASGKASAAGGNAAGKAGGNAAGNAAGIATGSAAVKAGGNAVGNAAGGPKFVIYTDKSVKSATGLPAPADIKGYTHLMLGFLLPDGPADQSKVWADLDATTRKSLKAQYAAAGIKVMVSAFGGTSVPTTDGIDPAKTAQTMGAFVKANNLDGIDVDYEDLSAVSKGTAVAWVETFMTTLRQSLPVGDFIVSHAPLAPHMSPLFPGASSPQSAQGPYLQIDKKVGTLIDFYNVQFYNDGATVYTDCPGLLDKSSTSVPKSSLFEIVANGISIDKLLIGKPIGATDATNGQMTPDLLAQCVAQAKAKGWNAGIMGFEFEDSASALGFIEKSQAALGGSSLGTGATTTSTVSRVGATGTKTGLAATGTDLGVGASATDTGLPAIATAVGVPTIKTHVSVPAIKTQVGVPAIKTQVGVPAIKTQVGVPGAAPTGTEPGAAPTGTELGAGVVPTAGLGKTTPARRGMLGFERRRS